MSDIAGFPTGDSPLETPSPAAESYTELPAEQLGLAAPYAPLTETDTADPDTADPGNDDDGDQDRRETTADKTLTTGAAVPAVSGPVPPRPDDPASVPVIAPQIGATAPPRPGRTEDW